MANSSLFQRQAGSLGVYLPSAGGGPITSSGSDCCPTGGGSSCTCQQVSGGQTPSPAGGIIATYTAFNFSQITVSGISWSWTNGTNMADIAPRTGFTPPMSTNKLLVSMTPTYPSGTTKITGIILAFSANQPSGGCNSADQIVQLYDSVAGQVIGGNQATNVVMRKPPPPTSYSYGGDTNIWGAPAPFSPGQLTFELQFQMTGTPPAAFALDVLNITVTLSYDGSCMGPQYR